MYRIILGLYFVFNIVPVYSASEGAEDPATQPKILCRRETSSLGDDSTELMLVRQGAFSNLQGQSFPQESLASTVRVAEFSQNFEEEEDNSDSGVR